MRGEPYLVRALRVLAAGRRLPVNDAVMARASALSPMLEAMADARLNSPEQRRARIASLFHQ
jgi:hypothetical protein